VCGGEAREQSCVGSEVVVEVLKGCTRQGGWEAGRPGGRLVRVSLLPSYPSSKAVTCWQCGSCKEFVSPERFGWAFA
jgi:hypothetical protein